MFVEQCRELDIAIAGKLPGPRLGGGTNGASSMHRAPSASNLPSSSAPMSRMASEPTLSSSGAYARSLGTRKRCLRGLCGVMMKLSQRRCTSISSSNRTVEVMLKWNTMQQIVYKIHNGT